MDIAQLKQQYPVYKDVPDEKLASGMYNKYYADSMSQEDFYKKIKYQPQSTMDMVGSAVRGGLAEVGKATDALGARVGKAAENAYKDIGTGVKQMQAGAAGDESQFVRGAGNVAGGAVGAVVAPLSGELASVAKGIGEGIYSARGGKQLEKGATPAQIKEIHQAGEETAQGEGEKWAALASMIGGGEGLKPAEVRPNEPIPPAPQSQRALPAPPQRLALPAPREVPQGFVGNQRGQTVPASPYSTKDPRTGLPTGQMGYEPNEPIPPRTQADRIKEVAASVAPKPKTVTPKTVAPTVKGRSAAESFDTGDELDRLLDNQLSRIDKTTRMDKATRQFNRENAPEPAISDFGAKVREATTGMFKAAKAPKGALRAEAINEEAAKLANVLRQMEKSKGSLTVEQVQTVKAALAEARRARVQDVLTPADAEATLNPKAPPGMYAGIEEKVNKMTAEQQALRFGMLNKKMQAGIITPKELAERETLSAQKKSPPSSSTPLGVGKPLKATEHVIEETAKPFEELDTPGKRREAKWLFGELGKKQGRDAAIDMDIRKRVEAAEKEITPELREKLYRWKEGGMKTPLSKAEKALYDKHLKYLNDLQDANYKFKIEYERAQEDAARPKYMPPLKRESVTGRPNYVHRKRMAPEEYGKTSLPGGGRGFTRKTSSWKGTVYWALEDAKGGRQVAAIVPKEGKLFGTILEGGKPTRRFSVKGSEVTPGTQIRFPDGTISTIKESMTDERAAASGEKYSMDLLKNSAEDAAHGAKVVENIKFLDAIKARMLKKGAAYQGKNIPEGFSESSVPQLRGTYFDNRLTEALNDYYKHSGGTAEAAFDALDGVNDLMTRWMFTNPLPHDFNMGVNYLVNRGLENFTHPLRLGKYISKAADDVKQFTPFYRQWMEAGGGAKYPAAWKAQMYGRELRQVRKDLYTAEGKSALKAWGLKTQDVANALLDSSQTSLWRVNDILNVARVRELMETRGMTMEQAIARTQEHLGAYRVPPRIGDELLSKVMGEQVGGKVARGVSALGFQHNPFAYFMRYHYDLMKAYGTTAKKLAYGDRLQAFGELATLAAISTIEVYGGKALVNAIWGQQAADSYVPASFGLTSIPVKAYEAYQGQIPWTKVAVGQFPKNPLGQAVLGDKINKPEDVFGMAHPFSDVYYPIKSDEGVDKAAFTQVFGGYFKK